MLLLGYAGRDVLNGGGGRDDLRGGLGADRLNGDGGRDLLAGGAGADTLDGGRGRDDLTGGLGDDLFVFSVGGLRDTITDFAFDQDRMQIVGANSFDDLDIVDAAAGAVVSFGAIRVLVEGVEAFDLIEDDFLF